MLCTLTEYTLVFFGSGKVYYDETHTLCWDFVFVICIALHIMMEA